MWFMVLGINVQMKPRMFFLIIIWFHWWGIDRGHLEHGKDYIITLAYLQALVLFTLLTEGVELDRLGDGGVFSILDTISEALTRLDLAGENWPLHFGLVICSQNLYLDLL